MADRSRHGTDDPDLDDPELTDGKPVGDERDRRLAELGFKRSTRYADEHPGQTLVMFFGEARADVPDEHTLHEAERDLVAALGDIERLLAGSGSPAVIVERVAQAARRERERDADALNASVSPPSAPAD